MNKIFIEAEHTPVEDGKIFVFGGSREGIPSVVLSEKELKTLDEDHLTEYVYKIFLDEYFYGDGDLLSEALFEIVYWHYSQKISFDTLNTTDKEKCLTLNAFSILNRDFVYNKEGFYLDLHHFPKDVLLLCPTIVKTPITSVKYSIEIDPWYTFNEIRKSGHPYSDEMIDYIYELHLVNYKVFHQLNKLLFSLHETKSKCYDRKNISLSMRDLDLIYNIEYLIVFLKALIEKMIALLAYTYEIKNIDSGKNHKSKINSLNKHIPKRIKEQYYFEYFMESVSSESIEKLNEIRTGLLHKIGVISLQPHGIFFQSGYDNIEDITTQITNYIERMNVSLILLMAMITDKLVEFDPPAYSFEELPCKKLLDYLT